MLTAGFRPHWCRPAQVATFPLLRLYIVCGVPESTVFETRTKKEISAITWHKIKDLPASREVQAWRVAPRLARDHGVHCGRDRPEIGPRSRDRHLAPVRRAR